MASQGKASRWIPVGFLSCFPHFRMWVAGSTRPRHPSNQGNHRSVSTDPESTPPKSNLMQLMALGVEYLGSMVAHSDLGPNDYLNNTLHLDTQWRCLCYHSRSAAPPLCAGLACW